MDEDDECQKRIFHRDNLKTSSDFPLDLSNAIEEDGHASEDEATDKAESKAWGCVVL